MRCGSDRSAGAQTSQLCAEELERQVCNDIRPPWQGPWALTSADPSLARNAIILKSLEIGNPCWQGWIQAGCSHRSSSRVPFLSPRSRQDSLQAARGGSWAQPGTAAVEGITSPRLDPPLPVMFYHLQGFRVYSLFARPGFADARFQCGWCFKPC